VNLIKLVGSLRYGKQAGGPNHVKACERIGSWFEGHGHKVEYEWVIETPELSTFNTTFIIPDLFIDDKLLVYIDDEGHDGQTRVKDRRKDTHALEKGYKVARIWQYDALKQPIDLLIDDINAQVLRGPFY